jgi:putative transposase
MLPIIAHFYLRHISAKFVFCLSPWLSSYWLFFKVHLLRPEDEYILAGDESVITKTGKKTYGIDRFFSSIYGKPVPGLAFFALSPYFCAKSAGFY